ncbi:MAG TPA: flagellar basal body rod protein FlgF [Allosphingosinicella sp.]|jgi:flagellar basal-body rod protein FlgF|nr:flagellar basal body rod protein FlgF [Allosphingosinicella sp.]
MDRIVHASLSAMRGAMARQAATAHNLANAGTVGFRADMSAAQSTMLHVGGELFGARASNQILSADMSAGTVTQTGRDMDVALSGDAMLAVQAPNGDESYTRRGDLQVTDSGLVTTGDGHPVLGEGGPLTLPPADSVRIDNDGSVWVVPQGGDPANPTKVDRLKLASPTGSDVVKGVDGLFRVKGGGALPQDPEARLTSKALEGSNVNSTQALIDMIEASRAWDTQMNLITSARELDTSAADLMRIPS